jgi:hypothetical protein
MAISADRPRQEYRGRVIPAVLVIAFGLYFLLDNLGIDVPFVGFRNWWAWLILMAAIEPLSQAFRSYRVAGVIDGAVAHSLLSATAIIMVALMFILQLSWSVWWPVFVIYGGLCVLTCNRRNSQESILP